MPFRADPKRIEVMDDAVGAILRTKSPAEKIAMIVDADRVMRLRIEGALRSWHPDWTDEQISEKSRGG